MTRRAWLGRAVRQDRFDLVAARTIALATWQQRPGTAVRLRLGGRWRWYLVKGEGAISLLRWPGQVWYTLRWGVTAPWRWVRGGVRAMIRRDERRRR